MVADAGEENQRFTPDVFSETLRMLLCEELHCRLVFKYGICVSCAGVQVLFAEWSIKPAAATLKINIPRASSPRRPTDYAAFSVKALSQTVFLEGLFEELVVGNGFAYVKELFSAAKLDDFAELLVLWTIKIFLEAELAH